MVEAPSTEIPKELGMEVGRGMRRAVKEENPHAYLLGENFFDASAQSQGDCWDAVMNYAGFAMPLWYWLSEFNVRQHGQPDYAASSIPWTTQALVDTWQAYRAAVPWGIARQQFNLLGSHDTRRILSVTGGDKARSRLAAGEDSLAYLRDSDHEQVILVGQRGPGQRPAGLLPVRDGGIPDKVEFTELSSGKRALTNAGALELATMPPGVEVWRAQI